MTDLERSALSGELFAAPERSSSPARTPSPDGAYFSRNGGNDDDGDNGDDMCRDPISFTPNPDLLPYGDASRSIGLGDGRTGVKGVIRDRAEAVATAAAARAREASEAARRARARGDLGEKTVLDEEEAEAAARAVLLEEGDARVRRDVLGRSKPGRFGHLREVGRAGFVAAVEREEGSVYVVVHLYDPSLDRCCALDDALIWLARKHTDTKFLHARASALGFASTSSSSSSARRTGKPIVRVAQRGAADSDSDEDDTAAGAYDDSDSDEDDAAPDTDMLPTVLVYQGGELVHNWVRVDWVAGEAGIEELLIRHRVIPQTTRMTLEDAVLYDDQDLLDI